MVGIAVRRHLGQRDEPQRRGIDAITLVSRSGAVIKDVAKVGIGGGGTDLGAFHAERSVRFLNNLPVIHGFGEAGPAAAGIEFVERAEQRHAGHDIHIDAGRMVVPVGIGKGRFRGGLLGDPILHGRELVFALGRRDGLEAFLGEIGRGGRGTGGSTRAATREGQDQNDHAAETDNIVFHVSTSAGRRFPYTHLSM